MRKNVMSEKTLEKKIIFSLKMLGFYVYKTASHGGCYDYNLQFNEAGISDLIILGGSNKVTFLEVKTIKGRQNAEQKAFEGLCKKSGLIYEVVRSVGEAIKAVKKDFK